MNLTEEWDDILVYLADSNSLDLASHRLEKVGGPFPMDPSQFRQAMQMASSHGLEEIFLLHTIAGVLAGGEDERAPTWLVRWLASNHSIEAVLPGLDCEQAMAMEWTSVPIPVVSVNSQGGLFQLIIARMEGDGGLEMPSWAQDCLGPDCLRTISKAFQAATNAGLVGEESRSFYVWPLLNPSGPAIRGDSLGLPFAMAVGLLAQGIDWPQSLMATGSIDEDLQVQPVGGLRPKMLAATEFGAKLFLYPDEETIDFDSWPIPALPVKSLGQAMTFAQLMALGLPSISNFRLYHSCLQDPNLLLDNFHQIPVEVLEWATERGMLTPLKDLAQVSGGFAKLAAKLGDSKMTMEHQKIMTSLFRESDLADLAGRSSQHALMVSNWCRTLVAMAQEERQFKAIKHWSDLAKKVLRQFGNKLYVFYRTEDFSDTYRQFDDALQQCLDDLPDSPIISVIRQALEAKLIYIHLPIMRGDNVSARVFFSEDNRVVAISLNAVTLGIDPERGETAMPRDCIYAVYLGLIRAACLVYRQEFLADDLLQRLLSIYLYKLIGEVIDEGEQENRPDTAALATVCAFYYARRFLGKDAAEARDWVLAAREADSKLARFDPDEKRLDEMVQCEEDEDLGAMLSRAGIAPHTEWLHHRLLVRLGEEARHGISGAMDHLMGMCLLSHYGCSFFDGISKCASELRQRVQALTDPYLVRTQFGYC